MSCLNDEIGHVDIRVLGFFFNLVLTLICPWLFYLVFTVKGCVLMGLVTVQGICASKDKAFI